MESTPLENVNVSGFEDMPTPEAVHAMVPLSDRAAATVACGRAAVRAILDRTSPRLLAIVGPCSIHDPEAALDYARRLSAVATEAADTLFIVMRVYFEKPRTSSGWKGYVNDPHMDDSFRIQEGILGARRLLAQFAELGLPAGTEALDPLTPQYLGDLVSWYAIGARTTESQTHREMASGLSAPVGFKNATDGSLDIAVNAIRSASQPHSFLGINWQGKTSVVRTSGNRHGHLVLRGGGGRPNYDTVSVRLAERALTAAGLPANIVVDCAHVNCLKDHTLQPLVFHDCVHQIAEGNRSIVGLMMESNLEAGQQPIPADRSLLRYGVSVTDPCVDWKTTRDVLLRARDLLAPVLRTRAAG
ncbi:MAG: 3-deoxy-7-phosphoheptulonate synthase [Acidobacteria bacterium]|nr:3-deoxy-7-phosphoheptulonate synthase [Acidobacteriota bacterium]